MDGVTQVAQGNMRLEPGDHPALEGAYVRVWFRGVPSRSGPAGLVAMARIVAIDSLAAAR